MAGFLTGCQTVRAIAKLIFRKETEQLASYIAVPRDLTKVKSKVAFNLTKRQLICFSLAALIGVPSFFLLKKTGNISVAAMGMMVIMMPLFFGSVRRKRK